MASTLEIKLKMDAGQVKAEAGEVSNAVDKLGGKVHDVTARLSFKGIKENFTALAFGFNQITQAAHTMGGIYNAAMDPVKEMQVDMAKVASLGAKNINELNAAIQEIGANKAVSLHDLRQGLYDVVSAGVDANYQIMVLDASARAAKAGIAQTSEALNLGAGVIKGYGAEWSAFETVMDKAFMTVNLGQTTFPELAGAMGQVVPLASALKINVNELFGAFATLTGVTGNTNEVATQLRGIMDGLASPTDKLVALVKAHGYATVEDAVKTEGLMGMMKLLAAATGGSATKMNEFFGRVEATNAALALSTTQYDQMRKATDAVTKSTGEMNKAFEIQNKTLEAQEQIARNRFRIIQEQLGKAVIPIVSKVAEGWTYILNIGRAVVDGKHWDAYAARTRNAVNDTTALATAWDGAAKKANTYGNEVVKATGIPAPPPAAGGQTVTRTVKTAFAPISNVPMGGEEINLDAEYQNAFSLNQALFDARQQSEEQFHQTKIALAEETYNAMVELHGKESLDAWQAAAQKKAAENDYVEYKKSINQQAAAAIGQLVTGMFAFTKAGAYASAVINTYEAATKALAGSIPPWNYIAMTGVILTGLAQVAKISETEIQERAAGGDVFNNLPYLIGERGPELFIPNRSGTVVSNDNLRSAAFDMSGLRDEIRRGFEGAKIEIRAEMDSIRFLRENYPKYQEIEGMRSI